MTILDQSLCLLDGVSPEAEIRFRRKGVLTCRQLANEAELYFSASHAARVKASFVEMCKAGSSGLADWFVNHLPVGHRVRALLPFWPDVTFYDIETDGMSAASKITCITTLRNGQLRTFVRGNSLIDFLDVWATTKILVGFNSKRFDTPIVCKTFGLSTIPAQVDLLDETRYFGFSGGLKAIERKIGFVRNVSACANGGDAVYLWNEYLNRHSATALEQLISYNQDDVRSLWFLSSVLMSASLENTQIDNLWPQIAL